MLSWAGGGGVCVSNGNKIKSTSPPIRLVRKPEKFFKSYPREPTDFAEGKRNKELWVGDCLEDSRGAKKRGRKDVRLS